MRDELLTQLDNAENALFNGLFRLDDIVLAASEEERDEAWRELRKSVHCAISSVKAAKKIIMREQEDGQQ